MSKLTLLIALIVAVTITLATARLTLQHDYRPSSVPASENDMMSVEEHVAMSHTILKYRKMHHFLQHEQFKEENQLMDEESSPNGAAIVDFSTALSADTLRCLRNNGFVAAIPRGYCSVGSVDRNMVSNVANARQSFQNVDVYMFPCPTCSKSPEAQFDELWSAFSQHHVNVGMVWIDVEGTQYWKDAGYNANFMTRLLDKARAYGAAIGIYASKYQWESIFGGWHCPAKYPLWYAHYNNNPSCSSFQAFGGFAAPTLKQYVGDTVQCGAGIDISSYC